MVGGVVVRGASLESLPLWTDSLKNTNQRILKASSQSTRGVESKSCRDLRMSPESFHGITQDDRGRLGQRMIRTK